jgi:hypothetical protein
MPSKIEQDVANLLEITNCERKSAYIANSLEIDSELDFLSRNYFGTQFNTGQDSIRQAMESLVFISVGKTKIPSLYRWMIDSGIYERLQGEKLGRKNKLRKSTSLETTEKAERLEGVSSLEGGLVTLFILCGGLISLALSCFILECRFVVWKLFVELYSLLKMWGRKKKKTRSKVRKGTRKIHVMS